MKSLNKILLIYITLFAFTCADHVDYEAIEN